MSKIPDIKGPAIFVAQYLADEPPFNSLEGLCHWASNNGYRGIQLPIDPRVIDIQRAATDLKYCESIEAVFKHHGLQLTELSSHPQGRLIAVHPAYDALSDGFAPAHVHSNPKARQE
jgi:sugar phosphate isomerase/epimerase